MIETKPELLETKNSNVSLNVIVFKHQNSNEKLLEKTMLNWVCDAVKKYETIVVEYNKEIPELSQIKNNLRESNFTLILHSFNPLITEKNIDLCIDYLVLRKEKLIKLPFGFVCETNYIKNLTEIKEPVLFGGDASEFLQIESNEEMEYATEVLQRRIIKNLTQKGVKIVNPTNVVINANVCVESGVTIFPFNNLCGNTIIKKNTVLKEGNTITNSEIGSNCVVANSIISNSTICSDCFIFPFNTIENNTFVGANCVIKSYNKINNAYIQENTKIESFNEIGN